MVRKFGRSEVIEPKFNAGLTPAPDFQAAVLPNRQLPNSFPTGFFTNIKTKTIFCYIWCNEK